MKPNLPILVVALGILGCVHQEDGTCQPTIRGADTATLHRLLGMGVDRPRSTVRLVWAPDRVVDLRTSDGRPSSDFRLDLGGPDSVENPEGPPPRATPAPLSVVGAVVFYADDGRVHVLEGGATSVAFEDPTLRGARLLWGDSGSGILFWVAADGNLCGGEIGSDVVREVQPPAGVAFVGCVGSGPGGWVALAETGARITVLDARTLENRASMGQGYPPIRSLAVRGDGLRLAVSHGLDMRIKVWSLERPDDVELVGIYKGGGPPCTSLAYSPDGEFLAAGRADGDVAVFHEPAERGGRELSIVARFRVEHGVAGLVMPDDSHVVVAAASGIVSCHSLPDGEVVWVHHEE